MNQAPLPKPPKGGGGRRAALNNHAKALASGNPFLHQAAITHLQTMNPTDKEIHYVRQRAQRLSQPKFNAKIGRQIDRASLPSSGNKNVIPATRGGMGGPGKQAPNQVPFVAESLTGYKEIEHIRQHPIAGGLAIAGLLPIGKIGKLGELAAHGIQGVEAGQKVEKGFFAARRAANLARRGPRMTPEASHAHLLDLSRQAAERPDVQRILNQPKIRLVKPGEVTAETGGKAGQIIRHGLSPNFKGMGKYEKVGAKLDNPGVVELRKQQEIARAAERSKKAGALHAAQQGAASWEQLGKAGAARAGELTHGVFHGFEGLQPHLEDLRGFLQNAPLRPFEKQNLVDAIDAGLRGHVPTEGEQALMERAFGRETADSLTTAIKSGGLRKALTDILNIPRAFKASADLSWGFRQGLVEAAANPKLFAKTFKGMFKPAASEVEAQARMAALHNHPLYPLAVHFGVPFTEIGSAEKGVANIASKEEQIMTNYAEHLHEIPGIKQTPGLKQVAHGASAVIRASDRAYVVPLNEIRMAQFDQFAHQALENGYNLTLDHKLGKDIAGLVGAFTGRGNLPRFLAQHRATINALFFSPGLMASRINMVNPFWYMHLEPFARHQALRAARNLTATLMTLLFAAKMAGAKVVTDPRNSDFGKIRIGNTRIDPAGGFNQYLTFMARLGSGKEISSTTGKTTQLSGKAFGTSEWDIIQNFFLNKLAPIPAEGVAIAKQSRFNQPLTPTGELGNLTVPLLWNDMYQLGTSKGPGGGPGMAAATFLPDLFGVGVQNYAPPKKKGRGSSSNSGNPYGGSSGGSSGNPYGGGGSSSGGNPYG